MTRSVWTLALLALVGCDGGSTDDEPEGRVADILALTGDATAGEQVYLQNCSTGCHQADGSGEGGVGNTADLNDVVPELTDAEIVEVILEGKGLMTAFEDRLSDQQIADVLAYVNAEFGD